MKRILLLSLFLLATLFTYAQKFHFGLTAAPGLAWLKSDTKGLDNNGTKIGFSYGIVTEFAFSKAENYAFATGLNVTYRGGKLASDTGGISVKAKINLEYLELPLTLKMKTNEIGAIKYFGQFGIVPALNLKSDADITIKDNTTSIGYKDRTQAFNLSLLIALGLEYNLTGNTNGFVSIGFNNGLIDFLKDGNAKAINNFLALNVGVLF